MVLEGGNQRLGLCAPSRRLWNLLTQRVQCLDHLSGLSDLGPSNLRSTLVLLSEEGIQEKTSEVADFRKCRSKTTSVVPKHHPARGKGSEVGTPYKPLENRL